MEQVFNTYEDVEDFARAWALQKDRAAGRHMPPRCREPRILQYREVASVGTQLERLAGQVPAERLLVLFHDDLAADPRALWLRVQAFLGLDDDGRTEFPVVGGAHFNRFPKLAALYQNPPPTLTPMVRALKRGLLLGAPRGAVNLVKTVLMRRGRRAPAPPELRREMAEVFAPEIAKVARLTGRDLTHWGRP